MPTKFSFFKKTSLIFICFTPFMFEDILPKQAVKPNFTAEKLTLKPDHGSYPFYINFDTTIYLETTHPLFRPATDFLIAIAEPISRAKHIHEYHLTPYSLYAAVSVGLTTSDILTTVIHFSKNHLPAQVRKFIEACTVSYGKVKMIVRCGVYYLEVTDDQTREIVVNDAVIKSCIRHLKDNVYEIMNVERIKKRCIEIDYPLIEEYDFRSCTKENVEKNRSESVKMEIMHVNASTLVKKDFERIELPIYGALEIDLKPQTQIRSYQETCLNKMFSNGRARSGIIVLPCGSGKTLVGITAICTMKQPTLILCTSSVSVEQWKQQIKFYTSAKDSDICMFTSDKKEVPTNILITTYTMLAYSGKRSYEAQKVMDAINHKTWGLIVLDEVHVVPATMFRRVVSVNHITKLGLTATLVREDDKIEDLNFLIGPKLYEADWQDLSAQGHIAQVQCLEVWCKMTGDFYREYLNATMRKRRVISVMNPTKFQICDWLIRKHESKGDKIIVFSDNVFALQKYAIHLNKPFIYGPTGQAERMRILKQFQTNPKINTIFLSKVGDTSIDLPEATCLIQISSHFGSRRQEAQRLGRILRAKKRNDPGFKVYFYSLVSQDTDEMFYSAKRQQFLVDQGYSFKVLRDVETEIKGQKVFPTLAEQKELLHTVLMSTDVESEEEESDWKGGKLKDVTGVEGMAYVDKRKKKM